MGQKHSTSVDANSLASNNPVDVEAAITSIMQRIKSDPADHTSLIVSSFKQVCNFLARAWYGDPPVYSALLSPPIHSFLWSLQTLPPAVISDSGFQEVAISAFTPLLVDIILSTMHISRIVAEAMSPVTRATHTSATVAGGDEDGSAAVRELAILHLRALVVGPIPLPPPVLRAITIVTSDSRRINSEKIPNFGIIVSTPSRTLARALAAAFGPSSGPSNVPPHGTIPALTEAIDVAGLPHTTSAFIIIGHALRHHRGSHAAASAWLSALYTLACSARDATAPLPRPIVPPGGRFAGAPLTYPADTATLLVGGVRVPVAAVSPAAMRSIACGVEAGAAEAEAGDTDTAALPRGVRLLDALVRLDVAGGGAVGAAVWQRAQHRVAVYGPRERYTVADTGDSGESAHAAVRAAACGRDVANACGAADASMAISLAGCWVGAATAQLTEESLFYGVARSTRSGEGGVPAALGPSASGGAAGAARRVVRAGYNVSTHVSPGMWLQNTVSKITQRKPTAAATPRAPAVDAGGMAPLAVRCFGGGYTADGVMSGAEAAVVPLRCGSVGPRSYATWCILDSLIAAAARAQSLAAATAAVRVAAREPLGTVLVSVGGCLVETAEEYEALEIATHDLAGCVQHVAVAASVFEQHARAFPHTGALVYACIAFFLAVAPIPLIPDARDPARTSSGTSCAECGPLAAGPVDACDPFACARPRRYPPPHREVAGRAALIGGSVAAAAAPGAPDSVTAALRAAGAAAYPLTVDSAPVQAVLNALRAHLLSHQPSVTEWAAAVSLVAAITIRFGGALCTRGAAPLATAWDGTPAGAYAHAPVAAHARRGGCVACTPCDRCPPCGPIGADSESADVDAAEDACAVCGSRCRARGAAVSSDGGAAGATLAAFAGVVDALADVLVRLDAAVDSAVDACHDVVVLSDQDAGASSGSIAGAVGQRGEGCILAMTGGWDAATVAEEAARVARIIGALCAAGVPALAARCRAALARWARGGMPARAANDAAVTAAAITLRRMSAGGVSDLAERLADVFGAHHGGGPHLPPSMVRAASDGLVASEATGVFVAASAVTGGTTATSIPSPSVDAPPPIPPPNVGGTPAGGRRAVSSRDPSAGGGGPADSRGGELSPDAYPSDHGADADAQRAAQWARAVASEPLPLLPQLSLLPPIGVAAVAAPAVLLGLNLPHSRGGPADAPPTAHLLPSHVPRPAVLARLAADGDYRVALAASAMPPLSPADMIPQPVLPLPVASLRLDSAASADGSPPRGDPDAHVDAAARRARYAAQADAVLIDALAHTVAYSAVPALAAAALSAGVLAPTAAALGVGAGATATAAAPSGVAALALAVLRAADGSDPDGPRGVHAVLALAGPSGRGAAARRATACPSAAAWKGLGPAAAGSAFGARALSLAVAQARGTLGCLVAAVPTGWVPLDAVFCTAVAAAGPKGHMASHLRAAVADAGMRHALGELASTWAAGDSRRSLADGAAPPRPVAIGAVALPAANALDADTTAGPPPAAAARAAPPPGGAARAEGDGVYMTAADAAELRERAALAARVQADLICPICMMSLLEVVPMALHCGHIFCETCAGSLQTRSPCPLCRAPISGRTRLPTMRLS